MSIIRLAKMLARGRKQRYPLILAARPFLIGQITCFVEVHRVEERISSVHVDVERAAPAVRANLP